LQSVGDEAIKVSSIFEGFRIFKSWIRNYDQTYGGVISKTVWKKKERKGRVYSIEIMGSGFPLSPSISLEIN
jgi:hypothetical protein